MSTGETGEGVKRRPLPPYRITRGLVQSGTNLQEMRFGLEGINKVTMFLQLIHPSAASVHISKNHLTNCMKSLETSCFDS